MNVKDYIVQMGDLELVRPPLEGEAEELPVVRCNWNMKICIFQVYGCKPGVLLESL